MSYPPKPKRDCKCEQACTPTDAIYYSGPNLPGTGIQTDTTLTEALQIIDNYILNLREIIIINNGSISEIPMGLVNGVNAIFTLSSAPADPGGVIIILDGNTQYNGIDYNVLGNIVTFVTPPAALSSIFAYYNTLT